MPDPNDALPLTPTPTLARPLAGVTVLVVEDSRFASEAMRLLCLKSGARIRRADSLQSAKRHLAVYLPSAIIIDLGLPDGSGVDLIRELANAHTRIPAIIATSGDDRALMEASDAGADGILEKPIESLALFQAEVLRNLPEHQRPFGPRAVNDEIVDPDKIAFQDDLAHIAEVLNTAHDDETVSYVALFLRGVARTAHDDDLEEAAKSLAAHQQNGAPIGSDLARVAGLLQERIVQSAVV